ncbi:hypothetical protein VTP01DRAFT_9254 [Rhizomucor pusillus]|uniref:uncharacterized protein n=1 Tax=Rhizomucor pusillus TaxID=4840 RepID=UPI0037434290
MLLTTLGSKTLVTLLLLLQFTLVSAQGWCQCTPSKAKPSQELADAATRECCKEEIGTDENWRCILSEESFSQKVDEYSECCIDKKLDVGCVA